MSEQINKPETCTSKIGKITHKNYFKFRVVLNEFTSKFEVIGQDDFVWAEATSPTGAVNGALACGVPLKEINYNGHYVKFRELNL